MRAFSWRAAWLSASLLAVTGAVVAALTREPMPRATVGQLVATGPSRHLVMLQGTVRALAPNRLALADPTGEIRLNTCPTWYSVPSFGSRERVRIVGHLAPPGTWRNHHPVFLVYRIAGEYGTRLTLRHNDGVPLWHAYRDIPGRRLKREISQESAVANWSR